MGDGVFVTDGNAGSSPQRATAARRVRLVAHAVPLVPIILLGVVASGCVEGLLNRVAGPVPPPASAEARALHQSASVVDLHADPLLWGRNLLERASVGQVDLPRLREGGVALQVFGLVTKFPIIASIERTDPRWPDAITLLALADGWPLATIRSLTARALYQADRFTRMAEASGGRLVPIRSGTDLDAFLALRAGDPSVVGGMLAIEGAHALDGDVANLGRLFDAGVRMIGLAHLFDNEFAGSAHGIVKGGLTEKGRALVREAERRGMLIDLAHSSRATIDDVLAIAHNPPVVSHTGVRGTCDNARNLADDQVRAIARAGGIIGIGFWDTAVCGVTPAHIASAIKRTADLVGADHVALGSDFDGAVTTGFDDTGVPAITQALLDAGLGTDAIRGILGGNALRLFRAVLPRR